MFFKNKCFIVLIFVVKLLSACDISLSHWCDTEENARQCEVYDLCMKFVWNGQINLQQNQQMKNASELVHLTLYYESLCPDCQNFILKQLYPVMLRVGEITDLVLIPYGNAHQKRVGSKWMFVCQHGPEECLGNVIQTCAIHFYPDVKIHFNFIHCMELSRDPPQVSAPKCAHLYGIDYNMVSMCANSSLGNMLEHEMGVVTEALQPRHTFVPWVTLNGVHTDAIQKEAQTNLLKLLCDAYKGPEKPQACSPKNVVNSL